MRGRLCTCSRWTDLAHTLGVPGVSRNTVLPAVPAGHAVRPGRPGRSAALGSQPAGFVIASPAFPPSAGPTSAGPPSTPRRAEQQPGIPEWRSPRPQRPPPGRRGAAGESAGRVGLRAGGGEEVAVTVHARVAPARERQGRGDCSVGPGGRCEATGAPRRPTNLRGLLSQTKRSGAGAPEGLSQTEAATENSDRATTIY